jgi:hypothetical protein
VEVGATRPPNVNHLDLAVFPATPSTKFSTVLRGYSSLDWMVPSYEIYDYSQQVGGVEQSVLPVIKQHGLLLLSNNINSNYNKSDTLILVV